jgi:hypothetical protein
VLGFFPTIFQKWIENGLRRPSQAMNNPATRRTAILAGYKEALDYALSNTQNESTRTFHDQGMSLSILTD